MIYTINLPRTGSKNDIQNVIGDAIDNGLPGNLGDHTVVLNGTDTWYLTQDFFDGLVKSLKNTYHATAIAHENLDLEAMDYLTKAMTKNDMIPL